MLGLVCIKCLDKILVYYLQLNSQDRHGKFNYLTYGSKLVTNKLIVLLRLILIMSKWVVLT